MAFVYQAGRPSGDPRREWIYQRISQTERWLHQPRTKTHKADPRPSSYAIHAASRPGSWWAA